MKSVFHITRRLRPCFAFDPFRSLLEKDSALAVTKTGHGGWDGIGQIRWGSKKIKKKKGPVDPLPNSPNSPAAMLGERIIPTEMDLRDVWDRAIDQRQRRMEKLQNVASEERFEEGGFMSNIDPERPWMTQHASLELTREDIQRYYILKKGFIQEAFREFYKFKNTSGEVEIPSKGCKTIYEEVQMTGSMAILYRKCMRELTDQLIDADPMRIWIDGKRGSGKSFALLSLVEWARSNQWLVLYLPTASAFLSDSFFTKRGENEMYDTMGAAKDILRSVHVLYGGEGNPLSDLSLTQPILNERDFGSHLNDLCARGLASNDPAFVCDAVVQLLQEFLYGDHDVMKLVAVDDYNALYWKTSYYRYETEHKKVNIPVQHVTLGNAFRVLEKSEAFQCHVVASSTTSNGIPYRLWIPKEEPIESVALPSFSQDEMHCVLYHFWKQGIMDALDAKAVQRLFFLTGGNMLDLRRCLPVL